MNSNPACNVSVCGCLNSSLSLAPAPACESGACARHRACNHENEWCTQTAIVLHGMTSESKSVWKQDFNEPQHTCCGSGRGPLVSELSRGPIPQNRPCAKSVEKTCTFGQLIPIQHTETSCCRLVMRPGNTAKLVSCWNDVSSMIGSNLCAHSCFSVHVITKTPVR